MITPLPEPLVRALDTLDPEALTAYRAAVETLLAQTGELSPQLDRRARDELAEVFRQLEARDGLAAARAAFRLSACLERLRRERESGTFVKLPALDALLVAGMAALQARGSRDAVLARLAPATAEIQRCYETLKAGADQLPAEVVEALSSGFDALNEGMKAFGLWAVTADDQVLEGGLADLAAGGQLVSHLAQWEREVAEQMRFPRTVPQSWDEAREALESWSAWWRKARSRVFLPAARVEARVASVDQALDACLRALEKGTALEEPAARLCDAVDRLEEEALELGHAAGTTLEPLAQMLAAAVWRGVPRLVLDDLVAQLRAQATERGEWLAARVASGEQLELLRGLEAVLGWAQEELEEAAPRNTIAAPASPPATSTAAPIRMGLRFSRVG